MYALESMALPVVPLMTVGTFTVAALEPVPHWPFALFPQPIKTPNSSRARACSDPHAIVVITLDAVSALPVMFPPLMLMGLLDEFVVLFPSWPFELSPHVYTLPVLSRIMENAEPAATAVNASPEMSGLLVIRPLLI